MFCKIVGSIRAYLDICREDDISAFAVQSALFIILSLIPFMMLFSGLLQYTPISEAMVLNGINDVMPSYIAPFVISVLDEVYNRSVGIVSVAGIVAIWSAAKGVQYISGGLNAVNGIQENRSWIVLRFYAIVDTIIFMLVFVILLVLLVFGNSLQHFLLDYIPVLSKVTALILKLRMLIIFCAVTVILVILYKALPNRKATVKSQLPGAVLSSVALYLFSFALSIYVDYFNGFSMYGSLTTIMLVMLWLYFCMYIILMCGEINYFFENSFIRMRKRVKNSLKF